MNRLTNYCGSWIKHCGWYPDRKLRLFDARCGSWGGTNPHDKYELHDAQAKTGWLKGDLLHYSYYSLEDHYKQIRFFTDIASKAAVAKGQRGALWKLVLSPFAKFFWDYFFRLGFMDGKAGFQICSISAYATYLKYFKIRKAWRES